MVKRSALSAIATLAALTGCTANQKAIHKVDNLEGKGPTVISVDAKQRAIIANWTKYETKSIVPVPGRPGETTATTTSEHRRKFCSEPSPDVFSVVAQALSVGGSFGQAANPATIEAALNASFSDSENGSTIARTQSTNLLRELMFRTCERYLNGAIGELEMSVQAARDHRLIVSILAIEQLTGAVTPKPVVISSAGGGTAGASGDAIVALEDARKSKEAAESARKAAQTKFDVVNGDSKICEANPITDDNKAKCQSASGELTSAKSNEVSAIERYQLITSLARAGGVSVALSNTSTAPGGLDEVQPQSIRDVALAVENIVGMNQRTDEFLFFCIKAFSDTDFLARLRQIDEGGSIRKTCVEYVAAGIESDAKERFDEKRYAAKVVEISDQGDQDFASFWSRASTNDKFDVTKFGDLLKSIPERPVGKNQSTIKRMASAQDKDAAQSIFRNLTSRWRALLAGKSGEQ